METNGLKVAISNNHRGQICFPTVNARMAGKGRVHVILEWVDQSEPSDSPKRYYNRDEFTGLTADAEKWLMSHGVSLDAQGIYGW